MNPLIAIPVQEKTPKKVLQKIKQYQKHAQVIEVWIDQLEQKHQNSELIAQCCKEWKKHSKAKLLMVCKDPREKGSFKGKAAQKVDLLIAAAQAGADYVDIGIHSPPVQIHRLATQKKKASLILSYHHFEKTPGTIQLQKVVQKAQHLSADVVKIATMTQSVVDTEMLINLARELDKKGQRHIILGMGQQGVITRILGKYLGNEITFVSVRAKTAPGQLKWDEYIAFQNILG